MNPFLAAQSVDPVDPVAMLIHADWLEERGDAAGAAVLRSLAGAEIPSIVALSLAAANVVARAEEFPDRRRFPTNGMGREDRFGPSDPRVSGGHSGTGAGDALALWLPDGRWVVNGNGFADGNGNQGEHGGGIGESCSWDDAGGGGSGPAADRRESGMGIDEAGREALRYWQGLRPGSGARLGREGAR